MFKQIWDKHKDIYREEGLLSLIKILLHSTKKRISTPIEKFLLKWATNTKTDEKTIIFQSEGDFCDNARALYEYMLANGYGKKYQLIWLVNNPKKLNKYKNSQVKFVKFPASNKKEEIILQYYKNKAKYFFFTHPSWLSSWKKDQMVINLFHGCGFKKSKSNIKIGNFYDICFVLGKFFIETEAVFYACSPSKFLDLGFSRNDILINQKAANQQNKQKTIIWMPTFRQSNSAIISENYINNETGLPLVDTNQRMLELDNFLILKGVKILLKIHHLSAELPVFKQHFKNIEIVMDDLLLQNSKQLYELVAETDALLTDYSSIAYDYLLLDRPIGFILADYDEYGQSRGFSISNWKEYMPGQHIYKFEELLFFIDSIVENKDDFAAERAKIRNLVYTYADSKSSERILNYLNITK